MKSGASDLFSSPCALRGERTKERGFGLSILSSPAHRHSERGIALVITLILLSVTLIMAVAFLAISKRERASVTTTTDSSSARLAADAALATAEAQITATAVAGGINAFGSPVANPFNFGLLVSTNYINKNSGGFVTGLAAYTNVNFYYLNGTSVGSLGTAQDNQNYLQLLANLYYLPRLPVYIPQNGTNDFRFYLDLNRNGVFDDTGFVPNITNGVDGGTTIFETGDPQWIGLLEHPDQPYGPNNKAIARFAFVAVPIGNALDLNAIHNQSLNPSLNLGSDGFLRNQGVGSWEINLAAFLADLNTNQWNPPTAVGAYNYYQALPPPNNAPNSGNAFADAFSLTAYRYNTNYPSLKTVDQLYSSSDPEYLNFFTYGGIDVYSAGLLQTNFDANYHYPSSVLTTPWLGADNTNHFYDEPSDLFNLAETTNGVSAGNFAVGDDFPARLLAAGTTNSTYDRYTFYRLLSQLGTDSTPETGKMNLNYDNLDPYFTNGFVYPPSETNFMPWTPIAFFTNAANRILNMYTATWATNYTTNFTDGIIVNPGIVTNYNFTPVLSTNFVATYNMTNAFGISDIPVFVSNNFVYTPAVNRLLQLAANLYEATSTNYYPSVYRPLFSRDQNGFGTNVYITGYTNIYSVSGTMDPQLSPPEDITALAFTNSAYQVINLPINIYGVPWIIGARKGFPNFNETVVESIVGVTRRLQFVRDLNARGTPVVQTNQMYMMSLNTSAGLDFWNSYSNTIPDNFTVDWRLLAMEYLTNSDANGIVTSVPIAPLGYAFSNSVSFTGWRGAGITPWSAGQPNGNSFYVPVNYTALTSLPYSVYRTPNASVASGTLPANPFFPPASLVPATNYFNLAGQPMTEIFETNQPTTPTNRFYVPQWGLLTTNQLQVYILDRDASGYEHVVDYVHLEQASSQNLNSEIFTDDKNGVWNNTQDTSYPGSGLPYGVYNQLNISRGAKAVPTEDGTWQGDPEGPQTETADPFQQANFNAFFYPAGDNITDPYNNIKGTNNDASVQAPYAPTRYAVGYTVLEANDPLVHYLASDLTPSFSLNLTNQYNNLITNVPGPTAAPFTLGKLNYNFQPWGGNPVFFAANKAAFPGIDPLYLSMEERDPLAKISDNWDFPTNKLPNVGWIGRVHRGTPWQTVYMKSTDILQQKYANNNTIYLGTNIWAQWTGDREFTYTSYFDAALSAPVQDRLLFDLFTTGINDNATRGQLSVNSGADQYDPVSNPIAGLAGWSAVLSGVVVPGITNSYSVINPAGPGGNDSAMGVIVNNINLTRSQYVNPDGVKGTFEHKGDILATPFLTILPPPYFNPALTNQNNDEMYEWAPQQIMGLLRGQSTPRYVIYCYGQTLKPAPNGIYTGSQTLANGQSAFGMVTNYQVTAESATRAVIRIDGLTDANGNPLPPTQQHPHAVIESENALPPD